ncbi:hypothetical protein QMK19_34275 [Streptomyces sp. H10-C2]|uniref:hypothetical protein n=1 Tax=unclassified Streptomyces TaxID=2593676 RepID=UPI0024BAE853|nr:MULTISPECIES: hypothetical protein [unclassified Streptomyces]MDJ0345703.1 hypothetical protein [Streptomyces sp. PH10-H1]MDJ0374555.1 hypothetical protein [Streptomyces sp. H10-C2]
MDGPALARRGAQPMPVLVVAHLAGAAALAWIVRSYLMWGTEGHRLLAAYPAPYVAAYTVMFVRQRNAGRVGNNWAREEWRMHLVGLCLAPALSVTAALPLERYLGLNSPRGTNSPLPLRRVDHWHTTSLVLAFSTLGASRPSPRMPAR